MRNKQSRNMKNSNDNNKNKDIKTASFHVQLPYLLVVLSAIYFN